MAKKHIAKTGVKAGQWVACDAQIGCRNGGMHVEEATVKAAQKWASDQKGEHVPLNALTKESVEGFLKEPVQAQLRYIEATTEGRKPLGAPQLAAEIEAAMNRRVLQTADGFKYCPREYSEAEKASYKRVIDAYYKTIVNEENFGMDSVMATINTEVKSKKDRDALAVGLVKLQNPDIPKHIAKVEVKHFLRDIQRDFGGAETRELGTTETYSQYWEHAEKQKNKERQIQAARQTAELATHNARPITVKLSSAAKKFFSSWDIKEF